MLMIHIKRHVSDSPFPIYLIEYIKTLHISTTQYSVDNLLIKVEKLNQ